MAPLGWSSPNATQVVFVPFDRLQLKRGVVDTCAGGPPCASTTPRLKDTEMAAYPVRIIQIMALQTEGRLATLEGI